MYEMMNRKSQTIGFYVSKGFGAEFRKFCFDNNIVMSDFIRKSVKEKMERYVEEQGMKAAENVQGVKVQKAVEESHRKSGYVRKTEDYIAVYTEDKMVFIGSTDEELTEFLHDYWMKNPDAHLNIERGRMRVGELARFKEAREMVRRNEENKKRKEAEALNEQIRSLTEWVERAKTVVEKYMESQEIDAK